MGETGKDALRVGATLRCPNSSWMGRFRLGQRKVAWSRPIREGILVGQEPRSVAGQVHMGNVGTTSPTCTQYSALKGLSRTFLPAFLMQNAGFTRQNDTRPPFRPWKEVNKA